MIDDFISNNRKSNCFEKAWKILKKLFPFIKHEHVKKPQKGSISNQLRVAENWFILDSTNRTRNHFQGKLNKKIKCKRKV